ncbi:MAG: STM4014 family protein [Clostridiales Family XIII bacterium]|jgi:glutathione synthase/RimK-type ligase-like ATP-grasp enzyme|nr:STM4014 family protein [Clostridiales Family XIII bacterium]
MEREIVLIGEPTSERTEYFLAAAQALHLRARVLPPPNLAFPVEEGFPDFNFSFLQGKSAKIDPPRSVGSDLSDLPAFAGRYRQFLMQVDAVPGLRLLNSGQALWDTLDKLECKRRLEDAGLPVTPRVAENPRSVGELRNLFASMHGTGLFIKPRFGSGAAGVLAWRRNPSTKAEVLYTSAVLDKTTVQNGGTLRRITDSLEIDGILDIVLQQETIVEEWMPKARRGGKSYDLRVIFQFGHVVATVARRSDGPVTNLHLNNDPAPVISLSLGGKRQQEIEQICTDAVRCFPGLDCAGFDILLTPGTLKPYVIEINGQGDFLHRDARGGNRVFREQVRMLSGLEGRFGGMPGAPL